MTQQAIISREEQICIFFQKSGCLIFEKLGLLCVAADTKSWSLASRKAANLLQHEAGEDDVDLYGGIAALGCVNGHLFLSSATKSRSIFQIKQPLFWKKRQICTSLDEKNPVE